MSQDQVRIEQLQSCDECSLRHALCVCRGLEVGDAELQQFTDLGLGEGKRMSPSKRRKRTFQSGESMETETSMVSASSGVSNNSNGSGNDNNSINSTAVLLQAAAMLGSGVKNGKPETASSSSSGHKSKNIQIRH